MIELKKEFKKQGTLFQQIYKDSCLAIYRLSRQGMDNDKVYSWFEVFRITRRASDAFHNDDYEKYPNDEAFGTWAWSCSNEESVRKVLKKHFKEHEPINNLANLLS